MNIETERKFLIRLPSEEKLLSQDKLSVRRMTQTYLTPDGDTERRIRLIEENGAVSYIYTEKRPIAGSKISRYENEREITSDEYCRLMRECISELEKTRYSFPFGGHIIEIDVYPHDIGGEALDGYAVLEAELKEADEELTLPDFIEIVRELTGTREFSNKVLAKPKKSE